MSALVLTAHQVNDPAQFTDVSVLLEKLRVNGRPGGSSLQMTQSFNSGSLRDAKCLAQVIKLVDAFKQVRKALRAEASDYNW